MRVLLLCPARRFLANRTGLGYQIPLGLVLIGGPLADDGHSVRLVDNDVLGWDDARLAEEIAAWAPDRILVGHTGSTAAHPVSMGTARALKRRLPRTPIVYGGVYPSYSSRTVLEENPAVDVVVRGEGEETVRELARERPLETIRGITWREGDEIVENPARPPIIDLDRYRPGWELVDWSAYSLFGYSPAAGIQFSRGCPLRCTYCGQWGFWKRWRHRSPADFVAQLRLLATRHRVRFAWLADENFAADRGAAQEVLERLAAQRLDLRLNLNMTAADVVRDADLLPLYKRAGVDHIVMGLETLDDATAAAVGKDNPFRVSREAVRLLRRHRIVSFVNIIYGLQEERWATLGRTLRGLFALDADVLNACYLTPHSWTVDGRSTRPADVIQEDLSRYTYRNQVIRTPHLGPAALFAGVKLTEALYHLRPRSILRLFSGGDVPSRRIFRSLLATGVRVCAAEIGEFLFRTRFAAPGTLDRVPGYPGGGHKAAPKAVLQAE